MSIKQPSNLAWLRLMRAWREYHLSVYTGNQRNAQKKHQLTPKLEYKKYLLISTLTRKTLLNQINCCTIIHFRLRRLKSMKILNGRVLETLRHTLVKLAKISGFELANSVNVKAEN